MLIAIKDEEAKLKERLDQSSMDLGNLRKDIEDNANPLTEQEIL